MAESGRCDVVIRGGTVYDGTGAPGMRADVAVRGERVAAVGAIAERGGVDLDAAGLAVSPGFIDVHSHDDFAVLLEPEMAFKVMQGVTTDIVGNCGSGVMPFEAALKRFQRLDPRAAPPSWDTFAGYLRRVDEVSPSCNVAVLIGHGSLRHGAMGLDQRAATPSELDRMRAWTREAVEAGAVGLSTGLIYEPGRYARTEEIITLARELGPSGGLYATHMRSEADGLLDAVAEAIRIGDEAGVPVQISHHKASGRNNWGRVRDSLRLIEQARSRGLDVTADQYPYTAGSTSLHAVIQNGAFRADSPGALGGLAAADVLIASAPAHPEWEGLRLADLGARWGLDDEATARRVVEAEGESCFVSVFTMSEDDVRSVMAHPTTMIGSDGVPGAGSKPHPRLYGCFPRVLGHYFRDERVLDLPTAIHRMTGMPAAKFRLTDRGVMQALSPTSWSSIRRRFATPPRTRSPSASRRASGRSMSMARRWRVTASTPGRAPGAHCAAADPDQQLHGRSPVATRTDTGRGFTDSSSSHDVTHPVSASAGSVPAGARARSGAGEVSVRSRRRSEHPRFSDPSGSPARRETG